LNWNEVAWADYCLVAGYCIYHDRPLNSITTELLTVQGNPVPYSELVVIMRHKTTFVLVIGGVLKSNVSGP
jgi:hypothetical protein